MSRRGANENWDIYDQAGHTQWEKVPIALLMDIREELQRLNGLLHCRNFINIPTTLRKIEKNTYRKPRVRKSESKV